MKLKKGDTVLIISGKDKGKKGKIVKAFPKNNKIVVERVNIRKKHLRPKRSGEKGQIVESFGPIDVSNAKFLCPKCSKPTRIGYQLVEAEKIKKIRVCKKCNNKID
ncbi:MAG: 50S ribosomal protein L24 [bacterium]|nr:50S ribosomal protein L24 [bacterium]